jgi:hypothetical protein
MNKIQLSYLTKGGQAINKELNRTFLISLTCFG